MPDRRGAALHRLRAAHEAAVLGELRRAGALSRAELIERLGLSRTTLFTIVSDLLAREAVVERPMTAPDGTWAAGSGGGTGTAAATASAADGAPDPTADAGARTGTQPPRGPGRPAMAVSLNPRGAQLIGIGLLPTRLQIVIANHAHEVVARSSTALRAEAGPDERVAAVVAAVGELVAERGVSLAPVTGVGLGLPGPVRRPDDERPPDPADRAASAARIVAGLGDHFEAPVATDNNTRLAALAEITWGAARGLSDIVYLHWSQGVGGGLVVDGRLVRGAHGAAGEIGHTSCDPRGADCYCGGRGCLEGVIGVPALLAECRARGASVRDGRELVARAASGERPAADVVAGAATAAGRVLAALAAQTDPACVVIAGELAALGAPVLDTVRAQLTAFSLPAAARTIPVRASTLGDDAAAQGAVAMLLHAAGERVDVLVDGGAPPPGRRGDPAGGTGDAGGVR
ncbi:ROK family transcriptional regulator [Streptomyces sp. NPDC088910]|uniref:ROK family transcriptional regulator n=1 Tax=Streptomyces sp. NPDC088910 TaxID=3365911 RepID=UPI0038003AAC